MLSNYVLVTEWPKLHEYAGAFCSSAWYLTFETLRLPGDSFLQQFSTKIFPSAGSFPALFRTAYWQAAAVRQFFCGGAQQGFHGTLSADPV